MPKIAEEVLSDKQVAVLMERAQAAVDDGWNPRMDAPVGSMSKDSLSRLLELLPLRTGMDNQLERAGWGPPSLGSKLVKPRSNLWNPTRNTAPARSSDGDGTIGRAQVRHGQTRKKMHISMVQKNDISRSPSARQFGVSAGTGAPHASGRLAGPAKVPRSNCGQVVPRR